MRNKKLDFSGIGFETDPWWILFLFWVFIVLMICLTSCGTCVHVSSDGSTTVQAGVMSSIQSVITQVKPGRNGAAPTITVSQLGYDGTSVPNNALGTLSTVSLANAAYKTVDSNNVAKTTQQANTLNAQTQQAANAQAATAAAAKTAAQTTTTATAISAGAKVKPITVTAP